MFFRGVTATPNKLANLAIWMFLEQIDLTGQCIGNFEAVGAEMSSRRRLRQLGSHLAPAAAAPASPAAASAARAPRARDLGVPFRGAPGATNSIVDVAGVAVGHTTLVSGEGEDAVRTGVTAVLPRGVGNEGSCYGGWFSMNGCGELTGMAWVEESGIATGPFMITGVRTQKRNAIPSGKYACVFHVTLRLGRGAGTGSVGVRIQNEELCIENEEFCNSNDDFCRLCTMRCCCGPISQGETSGCLAAVRILVNICNKNDGFCIKSDGFCI